MGHIGHKTQQTPLPDLSQFTAQLYLGIADPDVYLFFDGYYKADIARVASCINTFKPQGKVFDFDYFHFVIQVLLDEGIIRPYPGLTISELAKMLYNGFVSIQAFRLTNNKTPDNPANDYTNIPVTVHEYLAELA